MVSAVAVVGLGAMGTLVGCGGAPAPIVGGAAEPGDAPVRAAGLEPVESVLVLSPGAMLVAPVEVRGALPVGPIAVRVGSGSGEAGAELRGRLVWIGVRPRGEEAGAPAYALDWMGDPGRWSVTEAGLPIRPDATGMWAVVAPVPAGLPVRGATTVTIGSRPTPAVVVVGEAEGAGWPVFSPPAGLRRETVASMQASPWLARALGVAAMSPVERWRSRLAWRLLGRPDLAGEPAPGRRPVDAIADPVLEGLAAQLERRWAAGLARVHAVDPVAASELAWRLAAVVDMGGGVAMPAWGVQTEAVRRLGEDLVNPVLSGHEAATRARIWVSEQRRAVAWIADDAGLADAATGASITVAGVANLTLEPALAWAAYEGGARSAELAAAGALSAGRVACVAPVGGGTVVQVGVGTRTMVRDAAPAVVPVRPPGLRIGPLVPDMSMVSWLAHGADAGTPTPVAVEPEWATAALLYRTEAGAAGEPGAGEGGGGRWTLYIECRREPPPPEGATPAPESGRAAQLSPPGIGEVQRGPVGPATGGGRAAAPASEAREELRIWLGPAGAPSSRLRVFTSGLVLDDATPGRPAERVAVRSEPDRWACWVPLPAQALPADGRLRIAIERTDARGVRTAWPRPMLPWQREPGRVVVDLNMWGQ